MELHALFRNRKRKRKFKKEILKIPSKFSREEAGTLRILIASLRKFSKGRNLSTIGFLKLELVEIRPRFFSFVEVIVLFSCSNFAALLKDVDLDGQKYDAIAVLDHPESKL